MTIAVGNDKPLLDWHRNPEAIDRPARTEGIYALATNLPGRISASRLLQTYKAQHLVEQRHRDAKQTLRVRPLFRHNEDRIEALIGVVGLALTVFGLIEATVRKGLGPRQRLDGLLPEGREAIPTASALLAAFQGLSVNYTEHGLQVDPFTPTQRGILQILGANVPWPEAAELALQNCKRRG